MNERTPILALAVMGGIMATAQIYGQYAPSLQELRSRDVDDVTGRQQLMDADLLVGSVVVVAGGFTSWAAGNVAPLFVLLATFGLIAYWHHSVLNSTNQHIERR